MAYVPPLNGGRINATIGGNSTSAGAGYALMSTGTVLLAGGNNITLSQNGSAVTISAANGVAQTVQTQNLIDATLAGNSTSAGAGYALMSSGTMTLAGGNNMTLSQNGNAVTFSAASQSVQTQSRFNLTLSGNSTSAGAGYIQISSGVMSLAGGNNVTLSQNGNAVTVSAFNQTAQTQGLIEATLAGNSTSAGAGYILMSTGTMTLAGGNNITLSQNGNAVTISAPNTAAQTVQTQNLHDVTLAGNSTSAGAGYALVSSGTMTLAGGNNVTLSQNGQAVTISAANQTAQTQNLIDVTLAGNSTSAGAGYILASSGTLTLAGGNNITLSQNGNAVTISAPNAVAQSVQTQNLIDVTLGGNSTSGGGGYALISSGTLTLAGGNNLTVSQNGGNAITLSAANQSAQTQNLIDVTLAGNSTSAGAGYVLASSGTLTLAGGNNVTLSQNGQAVTISAANQTAQTQNNIAGVMAAGSTNTSGTISFANSNGMAFGLSNNTITGSYTVPTVTNSSWSVSDNATSGTVGRLAFTNLNGVTLSLSTGAGGSHTIVGSHNALTTARASNDAIGLNTAQTNVTWTVNSGGLSLNAAGYAGTGTSMTNASATLNSNGLQLSVAPPGGALNVTASNTSQNLSSLAFGSVNGVTFGLSTGVGIGTITGSITSQSNVTMSVTATSGAGSNTTGQSSTTSFDVRSLRFAGLGGASIGFSNSSILVSTPPGLVFSDGANSISSGTANLVDGGGVNFSINGQSISAIVTNQFNILNNTTGGSSTGSLNASGINISNYGAISAGLTGSTLQLSVPVQTNQNITMFAAGNTTSSSSNTTINASSLVFKGMGNVSAGFSAGSVIISATGGGGGGGVALYDGVNSISSGTAQITAQGAMTASINAQTLSLSVPALSSLSASGALTIATAGSTVNISAPGTSSLVGTNGISVSTAGSTMSIDGTSLAGSSQLGTVSNWEPIMLQNASLTSAQIGQGSILFVKLQPQANVIATQMMQLISISMSSVNSSHKATLSLAAGIYSANGSILSLMTQSSGTTAYTWTNSSTNNASIINGLRGVSMPMTVNMTPGNYWLGLWSSTVSSVTSAAVPFNMMQAFSPTGTYSGLLLAVANTSAGIQEGVGVWTVASAGIPVTAAMSNISQNVLSKLSAPYIVFKNRTF